LLEKVALGHAFITILPSFPVGATKGFARKGFSKSSKILFADEPTGNLTLDQ
jgi:predicted ABC-type transport system involved in lysophospholipase L1 biosynthesis ATPase subunit